MEFLATQQIKVSQRMAEEHAKQQMIERALMQSAESEDEGPLTRVGHQRNIGIQRMGIELPPLNAALVEAHRELVRVTMGAKDMATKNKNVWKTVKQTQAELRTAQVRIVELERDVNTAQHQPPIISVDIQAQQEEIEAQTAIAAKAKRALRQAESEIDRLHAELRQSSDRECDIWAKGRKAVRDLEEKWTAESAAHALTKEANNKLREEMGKLEGVNKGLRELMDKRKEAHNEQLQQEREETRQLQIRLTKEKDELNELHVREAAIWKEMKKHLEDAVTAYKQEILNLRKTLHEA